MLLVGRALLVGRNRGDKGRGSCWLPMQSLSIASHFELSSAAVSQVMSLVRSLLSLLDLSGVSRCRGRLPISWPVYLVPFLLGGDNWVPVGDKFGPTAFVVFGDHPCLPPVVLALPEDRRRDSDCC